MGLRPVSAPVAEPVTLAEAKAHLRVTHSDDDAYITRLISAARAHIEDDINRAIATQTWRLTLDQFPCSTDIRMDFGPVVSITSVAYDDADGIEQTVLAANYFLDNQNNPAWLVAAEDGWPDTLSAVNAVRIDYVAGWDSGMTPPGLIQALLMLVGEWYDNREAATDKPRSKLPHAVDRLTWPHRVFLS